MCRIAKKDENRVLGKTAGIYICQKKISSSVLTGRKRKRRRKEYCIVP
jgi:hypothetical protein